MSGARTSRWCGLALGRQPNPTIGEGTRLKIRLGVDVACRAAHQASLADEQGRFLFVGHRFRTDPDELDTLWARLPKDAERIEVVMEPTRNAWVALAAWFRRHGATVVMVPPEQSADLRDYYNKHTKTDRLDSKVLARLPLLHPEGLHREDSLGPGDELKRAVKIRSGLVHRRTACMARLDALLEILGPAWIAALGSDMPRHPRSGTAPRHRSAVPGSPGPARGERSAARAASRRPQLWGRQSQRQRRTPPRISRRSRTLIAEGDADR